MKKIYYECNDLNSLGEAAEILINYFRGETKFAFFGEIGAGKTTLISLICKELGCIDEVNSPTYTIVNEYETNSNKKIFHLDCYRLETELEAMHSGIDEIVNSEHFCLIEWPQKIEGLLTDKLVSVNIDLKNDKRLITMQMINKSEVLN